MNQERIRIAMADDHPVVRAADVGAGFVHATSKNGL